MDDQTDMKLLSVRVAWPADEPDCQGKALAVEIITQGHLIRGTLNEGLWQTAQEQTNKLNETDADWLSVELLNQKSNVC